MSLCKLYVVILDIGQFGKEDRHRHNNVNYRWKGTFKIIVGPRQSRVVSLYKNKTVAQ